MSQQKPPLFDLFMLMREEAGLPLAIDEYYLLLEALKGGFGIASREELKQICRLLWIKSQFSPQAESFEECFDEYFKRYDERLKPVSKKPKRTQEDIPSSETPLDSVDKDESESLETPPDMPSKSNLQVPIAIRGKLLPKKLFSKDIYQLSARDFPVTERQIQQSWRYLRRPIREGALTDIDIEATIQQVCQQGIFLEPVLISNRINRAELLLLIDVSNSMVPFYLLSQKLVDNLQGGRLGKADIYYFRNCPGDYLYFHPQRPQAKLIHDIAKALASHEKLENLVQFSSLMESYADTEPLINSGFQPLLTLSRGLDAKARGDEDMAEAEFEKLRQEYGNRLEVEGVSFDIPLTGLESKFEFEFEVVTVNRRGEIIKWDTKQAEYFIEDLGDDINLEMMAIPGGKFMMGSPDGEGDKDEYPQHEVNVPPFFMGKYLVTQAQWKAVAKLPKIESDLKEKPSRFSGDDLPVDSVSWYDAEEFCKRFSKKTGRQYRLPTEAEWEYACRAKTTTPFHFGETITGKLANYKASKIFADEPEGEYRRKTTSVKTFTPNAFGLFDMHGNLWEWCADIWQDNYEVDNDNGYPVLRGGSWNDHPLHCRSAKRYRYYPSSDRNEYGFRVVCGAAARTH